MTDETHDPRHDRLLDDLQIMSGRRVTDVFVILQETALLQPFCPETTSHWTHSTLTPPTYHESATDIGFLEVGFSLERGGFT